MSLPPGYELYLAPTYFLDSDHPDVIAHVKYVTAGLKDPVEIAIRLFDHVRDEFWYNPYIIDLRRKSNRTSELIKREDGHCVNKAQILATFARVCRIPSKLELYIVRNHLAVGDFSKIVGEEGLIVCHGAAGLYLNGDWFTTTSAFNSALCDNLLELP